MSIRSRCSGISFYLLDLFVDPFSPTYYMRYQCYEFELNCRQLFGFLYIKLNSRFIRFDCWSWNFPAEQGKTELIDIAKRSLKLNIYDFQWSWKSTNYYSAKLSLIHVKNMAFSSFHPCRFCVSEQWRHAPQPAFNK